MVIAKNSPLDRSFEGPRRVGFCELAILMLLMPVVSQLEWGRSGSILPANRSQNIASLFSDESGNPGTLTTGPGG